KVIWQNPFKNLTVFELQPHPQSLGARPSRECLAEHEVGIGKLPHKIDGLDVAQVDSDNVTGSIKQFKFPIDHKISGGDETADRVAVVLAHDNFFVSRGHWGLGCFGAATNNLGR